MGTCYTSYCEKCKLAIDNGKDYSGIRYELFKLYHNFRYKDHEIIRCDDDQWSEKWYNDKDEPEELYDDKLGYLILVPQWLEEIIETETDLWIKNGYNYQNSYMKVGDVISKIVEENREKLLTEHLDEFENRLKRVFVPNEQYDAHKDRHIKLLQNQRLTILTDHGNIHIDDRVKDINLIAVRNGKRIWITELKDDKILKYGTEKDPTDGATMTDVELVEELKRRGIKIEIPGNDNRSDFCSSERPRCYSCGTVCSPITKIKIGDIIFDIEEDETR